MLGIPWTWPKLQALRHERQEKELLWWAPEEARRQRRKFASGTLLVRVPFDELSRVRERAPLDLMAEGRAQELGGEYFIRTDRCPERRDWARSAQE